jgi:hypothetical protein
MTALAWISLSVCHSFLAPPHANRWPSGQQMRPVYATPWQCRSLKPRPSLSLLKASLGSIVYPPENANSELPGRDNDEVIESLQKALTLRGLSNRAQTQAVVLHDASYTPTEVMQLDVCGDDDPEATYLWSKLPDKIKKSYKYVKVAGRGAFGIVALGERIYPIVRTTS